MAWVVSAVASPARCEVDGTEYSVLAVRVRDMDGSTQLLVGRPSDAPTWLGVEEIDGGAWIAAAEVATAG